MNTLTNRIAMFAASAVVLGTLAYGQTTMKADVPFDFRTPSGTLPAGKYLVGNVNSASTVVASLRNADFHHSAYVIGKPREDQKAGAPALLFRCSADGCDLIGIRSDEGTTSYLVKARKNSEVSVIAIPIQSVKAD